MKLNVNSGWNSIPKKSLNQHIVGYIAATEYDAHGMPISFKGISLKEGKENVQKFYNENHFVISVILNGANLTYKIAKGANRELTNQEIISASRSAVTLIREFISTPIEQWDNKIEKAIHDLLGILNQ